MIFYDNHQEAAERIVAVWPVSGAQAERLAGIPQYPSKSLYQAMSHCRELIPDGARWEYRFAATSNVGSVVSASISRLKFLYDDRSNRIALVNALADRT